MASVQDRLDEDEVSEEDDSETTDGEEEALLPYQKEVDSFYERPMVQYFVAFLITLNFFFQCLQRQMCPDHEHRVSLEEGDSGTSATDDSTQCSSVRYFTMATVVFNVLFLIELLINMYGNWPFREFIKVGWNQFDCIVVALGVVDLLRVDLPGPFKMIRMVRAFRIFRLFGRINSLRKILDSLNAAAASVMNTLLILIVVMCIFAVMAVDIYGKVYGNCKNEDTEDGETYNDTLDPPGLRITKRSLCYGEDYYGTFIQAFWTMFQILTGESWSEAAVRPALHHFYIRDMYWSYFGTMAFFMFFIVISGIVLMNVFVAVLLDATSKEKVYFGTFKHPAFSDGKDTEIRVKFEKATSGQWNVPGQTESITIRQLDSRRVHLEDTDKVICLQGHSDNSGVIIKGLMTMKGDNRTGSFILQAENPFFEGDPIVFKGMNAYQFPDLIVDGEIRAVIGEMVEFDIFPQGGKRSIRKESCNYNAGCIKKATSSDGVMCIKAEEDQEITVDDIEWFRASVLKKVRAIGKQVEAVASKVEAM